MLKHQCSAAAKTDMGRRSWRTVWKTEVKKDRAMVQFIGEGAYGMASGQNWK